MRSEVSSLTFNHASLLRFFPGTGKARGGRRSCGFRRVSPSARAADDDRGRPPVRTVGSPEPPWFVVPPSPPENVPSVKLWPSENQTEGLGGGGAAGVPLSLRMVQMKNRLAVAAPPRWSERSQPAAAEDPAGRAVSALVYMIGELQRSVLAGRDGGAVDESVLDRVSRDRRDSFVWLFRRVFFSSPNLVVSLLVLLANYVAFSAESNSLHGGATTSTSASTAAPAYDTNDVDKLSQDQNSLLELEGQMLASTSETIGLRGYLNWFDIGIKEGNLDPMQQEDEETCADRRRRVYERAIAEGEATSLILCNYAQFLCTVANDHDRAELYFQWAVMAEPRDPEAISRYAFFLWDGRGDISGAEEMFLEAIEVEPGNHYYSSNYAWFLWKTGALDTCYPINPPPPAPEW
ncbi:unnamed protein product [Spirodela intermedia]|uniref:Uncharacterized protein n=1 Tax=Spirodela intermedia TaxID=51605 RepID=A0A7I8KN90_SPIIN|nr:unnamed protein product [Spirodela intermedia]